MLLLPLLLLVQQPSAPVRADTVRATITAELREDSPRTPHIFGVVTGLAIDAAGRVYVSDGSALHVAVFTTTGSPVTTIGRKGRGPGEFEYPTGPVVGNDGALYVRNMSFVSRFVSDPKSGALARFDRAFPGPSMAPWMSKLPTTIDAKGRLYFPMEWGSSVDGLEHNAYSRYTFDGRFVDTIAVPIHTTARSGTARVAVSATSGRMLRGLNVVPFHPLPVFTVSNVGNIVSSPSDKYVLIETDTHGATVRTIQRNVAPLPIPTHERNDSTRALTQRIDSLPVPFASVQGMSEEVRARRLPTTYPIFRSLSTAADGTIWARRWSGAAQRTQSLFDVLRDDGKYVHTVIVPADCATLPVPAIRGDVFACVRQVADTGEDMVVIARITSMGRPQIN